MKYMGSKAKIAKHIVPIIQKYIDDNNITVYWEPFAGGMNVIDKIRCENRMATDINPYLIAMFKELIAHPEKLDQYTECTKEHYSEVRDCYHRRDDVPSFPEWYIGYIGFCGSQNGRFFDGGYAKSTATRNYFDEARRNLKKQIPNLTDIYMLDSDYRKGHLEHNPSLIYCDPPYLNTKKYDVSRNFDYDAFYDWCREQSKEHIVLISESTMPDDFEVIWETKMTCGFQNLNRQQRIERLYKHKGGII